MIKFNINNTLNNKWYKTVIMPYKKRRHISVYEALTSYFNIVFIKENKNKTQHHKE